MIVVRQHLPKKRIMRIHPILLCLHIFVLLVNMVHYSLHLLLILNRKLIISKSAMRARVLGHQRVLGVSLHRVTLVEWEQRGLEFLFRWEETVLNWLWNDLNLLALCFGLAFGEFGIEFLGMWIEHVWFKSRLWVCRSRSLRLDLKIGDTVGDFSVRTF